MKKIIVVLFVLFILGIAFLVWKEILQEELTHEKEVIEVKKEISDQILVENARNYLYFLKQDLEYKLLTEGRAYPEIITTSYVFASDFRGQPPVCVLLSLQQESYHGDIYYEGKTVVIQDGTPISVHSTVREAYELCKNAS